MARKAKPTMSRLSEIRVARGLEPAELARAANNMQLPTLRKYEKGERRVSEAYAPLLAQALRIEVKELYAPLGAPIPEPIVLASDSRKAQLDSDAVQDFERRQLLAVWGRLSEDLRVAALLLIEAAAEVSQGKISHANDLTHQADLPAQATGPQARRR